MPRSYYMYPPDFCSGNSVEWRQTGKVYEKKGRYYYIEVNLKLYKQQFELSGENCIVHTLIVPEKLLKRIPVNPASLTDERYEPIDGAWKHPEKEFYVKRVDSTYYFFDPVKDYIGVSLTYIDQVQEMAKLDYPTSKQKAEKPSR